MDDKFLKITNAAYGVMEFFPESEPLKNRAKEKVLTIMENLTLFFNKNEWAQLRDFLPENRGERAEKLLEDIEILLNFLKLGRLQGWLSDANFLIISNEYEKIGKEVLKTIPQQKLFGALSLKTEKKDEAQKQTAENVLPLLLKEEEKPKEKEDFSEELISLRQKKILKFLAENKKAQVMNLQAVLGNITKRTIRRDLDDLLEKRRVVRVGRFNQIFYQISENSR